jgi:hypothetical protein
MTWKSFNFHTRVKKLLKHIDRRHFFPNKLGKFMTQKRKYFVVHSDHKTSRLGNFLALADRLKSTY